MLTFLSAEKAFAFSSVVTTIPALPSAGWVWAPKVTTQPSLVFSRAIPSSVQGVIPSSSSTVMVFFLDIFTSAGIIYRFWNSRSLARASVYLL